MPAGNLNDYQVIAFILLVILLLGGGPPIISQLASGSVKSR